MRFMIKAALAAAVAICVPAAASAQNVAAGGVVVEANAARAHDRWGGELGVGYRIGIGGFALTPAIGAFIHQGDNDRYYADQFENGQSRCRDSTNGQFADDALCSNIAAKAYGRIEATYTLTGFEFGAGARFSSEKTRAYGTVAVPLGPMFKLKGNVGDRYYALGVSGRF